MHKEIPLMEQTLLWKHMQEIRVINQKSKGNRMMLEAARRRQEAIKVFKEEPEKQESLDDISEKKIKLGTCQQMKLKDDLTAHQCYE